MEVVGNHRSQPSSCVERRVPVGILTRLVDDGHEQGDGASNSDEDGNRVVTLAFFARRPTFKTLKMGFMRGAKAYDVH